MWVGTEKRIEKNVFVAYEKKNIINKKERRIIVGPFVKTQNQTL